MSKNSTWTKINCLAKGCETVIKIKLRTAKAEDLANQFFKFCKIHENQFLTKINAIDKNTELEQDLKRYIQEKLCD